MRGVGASSISVVREQARAQALAALAHLAVRAPHEALVAAATAAAAAAAAALRSNARSRQRKQVCARHSSSTPVAEVKALNLFAVPSLCRLSRLTKRVALRRALDDETG